MPDLFYLCATIHIKYCEDMKRIILLLALCLLGGTAFVQAQAQNKKEKQEVVKLKNGHRVRGKIVTYAPLDSLVIQEDDGTLKTIY